MGAIYCYTNLINGMKYVGQTINDHTIRRNQHKSNSKNKNSSEYNSKLHQAFREFGYDNFKYEVLVNNVNTFEELNAYEIYYIKLFNCQFPNGYNKEPGGINCSKPKDDDWSYKLIWGQAKLSESEIIELRKAYQRKESPSKIYNEFYKDRLHYNSFLNIWSGKRYARIMPEVFNDEHRHTKLNATIVKQIKADRQNENLSYQKLADKYGISKSTIADIIKGKTWKDVH